MIALGHLDVNVTTICNFRCISCSHASPFSKPYSMSVETMARDLEALRPFVRFKRVQMVGGEPTLHQDIARFLTAAARSEVADRVSIVTNGSKLTGMPDEFWRALHGGVMQLSIYARLDPSVPLFAEEKCREHEIELEAWEFKDFYKQIVPPRKDPYRIQETFDGCPWKSDCYTVHEGHFYLCPQSLFFPPRFLDQPSHDGLPLEGLTEEKLNDYLHRSEPFAACRICAAPSKEPYPWGEARNYTEWMVKTITR